MDSSAEGTCRAKYTGQGKLLKDGMGLGRISPSHHLPLSTLETQYGTERLQPIEKYLHKMTGRRQLFQPTLKSGIIYGTNTFHRECQTIKVLHSS